MIASYFEGLNRTLVLEQAVDSFRIVKELFGNKDGFIRIKCHLQVVIFSNLLNTFRLVPVEN